MVCVLAYSATRYISWSTLDFNDIFNEYVLYNQVIS